MTDTTDWLTYVEAGAVLGIKPQSAKRRAMQRKWPRQTGNDGLARIKIPDDCLPSPAEKNRGDDASAPTDAPTLTAGEGEILRLSTDLAASQAECAGLRDRLADAHADRDRLAGLLEKALEPKPSLIARILGR